MPPKKTAAAPTGPGTSSTPAKRAREDGPPAASQAEEQEEETPFVMEHDEHYVTTRTDVVGVQYYRGMVGRGQYVQLQREPSNPYDSNAIKARIQVVNAGQNLDGAKHYKMGMDLSIFGNFSMRAELEPQLRWALPYGKDFNEAPLPPGMSHTGLRGTAGSGVGLPPGPEHALKELLDGLSRDGADHKQADSVLDALTADFDASKLPFHPSPPGIANGQLLVDLLPHQSQGLQWMIEHEHPKYPQRPGDPAVQFWARRKGEYPELGKGGIIADGMGLGKTLATLALVLATKNDTVGDKVSNATLIVCPLSVLSNWEKQIKDHVAPNGLSVCTYYGAAVKSKNISAKKLGEFDVVLTTYQVLMAEMGEVVPAPPAAKGKKPKAPTMKGGSALSKVSWKRVVADKGHQLKNPKTKVAIAFTHLKAERRWVCTGTPIINSIRRYDLGSLLTCLHICNPLSDPSFFRTIFSRPLARADPVASQLLQALVQQIMLRRTKDSRDREGKKIVDLLEIEYFKVPVKLDEQTRAVYDEILEYSKRQFEEAQATGRSAAHVFSMLTRMRQLCLSIELIPESFLEELRSPPSSQPGTGNTTSIASLSVEQRADLIKKLRGFVADEIECGVCMDEEEFAKDPAITDCGHPFCLPCIQRVIATAPTCPMDRHPLALTSILQLPPTPEEDFHPSSQAKSISSSKISELLRYLSIFPTDDKTLVFSQFTSFLDCVGERLQEEGVGFVRFDGRMTEKNRAEVIRQFQRPVLEGESQQENPRVMLISLKSGAVGLNLAAASNVFLCDPWWQSAIEAQAVDRAHRMGQKKTVRVFQLIAEDTVESAVLDIQKRKDELVAKAFEKSSKDKQKAKKEARFEDLKELLGMKR
ncbi:hypothetical protein IAT38_003847 [Cryptococcus sp. DSM 104549]